MGFEGRQSHDDDDERDDDDKFSGDGAARAAAALLHRKDGHGASGGTRQARKGLLRVSSGWL